MFFKSVETNRKNLNFSEYGLKGDFTSFNLPNAFSTSFTPNINRNMRFMLQEVKNE